MTIIKQTALPSEFVRQLVITPRCRPFNILTSLEATAVDVTVEVDHKKSGHLYVIPYRKSMFASCYDCCGIFTRVLEIVALDPTYSVYIPGKQSGMQNLQDIVK